jgi:hypothetical protein
MDFIILALVVIHFVRELIHLWRKKKAQ